MYDHLIQFSFYLINHGMWLQNDLEFLKLNKLSILWTDRSWLMWIFKRTTKITIYLLCRWSFYKRQRLSQEIGDRKQTKQYMRQTAVASHIFEGESEGVRVWGPLILKIVIVLSLVCFCVVFVHFLLNQLYEHLILSYILV